MVRLEQIKEEQRKIEEEAKEQAKIEERKLKEQSESLKPVATPELPPAQAKVVESVSPIKKATVTEVGEVKDATATDDDKYIFMKRWSELCHPKGLFSKVKSNQVCSTNK